MASSEPPKRSSSFFARKDRTESRTVYVTPTGEANKGSDFKSNAISTGKYNVVTFFPKGLYEQFRRVANLYFLSVAIISLFEAISPIKPYTIWSPLVLVVGLSMAKEAVEDYARHQQDHQQNVSLTERFNGTSMTKCEWREVQAGDIVRVVRDQSFPCDIVLLSSSLEDSVCYVETKNLDGETNLKIKRGVEGIKNLGGGGGEGTKTMQDMTSSGTATYVECEHPNNSLYTFTGNLDVPPSASESEFVDPKETSRKISLVPANVLLRGSSLRNTEWVIGIAIYTGHDSKVMMNSSAAPSKRSSVERGMDTIVLAMLGLLFVMSTVSACVCGLWIKNTSPKMWYLETNLADMVFDPDGSTTVGIVAFLTSYVLYGYLIPISLYVSLEFVKVIQAMVFLNSDRQMYHADTDTPMRARTSNLNEELGMVHTVLSDKTGTLTCNSMEFFKCSIAGVSYGEGVTEIERSIAKRAGKPVPATGSSKAIEPGFNFVDSRLEENKWMNLSDAEAIRDFFRVLGVCHTVIPEGEPTPDKISYQAESPDEAAFVVAAKRFGYFFNRRTTSGVDLLEPVFEHGQHEGAGAGAVAAPTNENREVHFEVLNILEFNSTRKRMSTIVRTPEGRITLYCKGADSIIYERLEYGTQKFMESTQAHMDDYAASGLRTLCLAKRELSEEQYAEWNKTYTAAAQSLERRDEKIDAAAELIEKDLYLVGATAIEDKLQEGVPWCIEQMMRAGIAVWVLTGDKQDTAINIGQACALIRDDMDLHVVNIQELVKQEADRDITREEFDRQARESVKAQLQAGIKKCDEAASKDVDMSMVIDGRSLSFALEKDLAHLFLSLGSGCTSVVCCRVSPLQKALVTGLVKDSGRITLAIGDGANDVGMIQAAHIGVGISGQEGMQAVMASDFAFAQFRFLERLLLVHGRYNYKRVSRMVTYFFYKNLAFGLTLFMYNLHAGGSGQVVYNEWLMSAFNIFMVSAPVIALGCLDQDVSQKSCLQFPHLYRQGQRNECFTAKVRLGWALNGIYQAIVCFFLVFYLVHGGEADHPDGHVFGLWEVGTTLYTAIVIAINLQMAQMINYWTWLQHLTIWGSVVVWYACNVILSDTPLYLSTYSYKNFMPSVAPTAKYWIVTPLVVMAALLPDLLNRGFRRLFVPELHFAVQEYERNTLGAARARARKSSGKSGAMDRDVEAGSGGLAKPTTAAAGPGEPPSRLDSFEEDEFHDTVPSPTPKLPPSPARSSFMRQSTLARAKIEELPGTLQHYEALQAEMAARGQKPSLSHTSSAIHGGSSSVVVALEKSHRRLSTGEGGGQQ